MTVPSCAAGASHQSTLLIAVVVPVAIVLSLLLAFLIMNMVLFYFVSSLIYLKYIALCKLYLYSFILSYIYFSNSVCYLTLQLFLQQ